MRSTEHALLKLQEFLFKHYEEHTVAIFLDVRKAFDSISHSILLKKLEHYGILGVENFWLKNYLENRTQRVKIGQVTSDENLITCGVPQGSILGPLLFILYVNDLPHASQLLSILFADDTALMFSSNSIQDLKDQVTQELGKVSSWFSANLLCLNPDKSKFILFKKSPRSRTEVLELSMGNNLITRVSDSSQERYTKYLGYYLDENLSWNFQLHTITKHLNFTNFILACLRLLFPKRIKVLIYHSLVTSYLRYYLFPLLGLNSGQLNKIALIQKKMIRNICSSMAYAHTESLFLETLILPLHTFLKFHLAQLCYKIVSFPDSHTLSSLLKVKISARALRSDGELNFVIPRLRYCKQESLAPFILPNTWNSLPPDLKEAPSPGTFSRLLLGHLETDATAAGGLLR